MSDLLNFVMVWAIWENVPENVLAAMGEWIVKNQITPSQVKMDKDKAIVSAKSQLAENMRLQRVVDLPPEWPEPTWFRISVSEAEFKGPRIAVVNRYGQLIGGSFVIQGRDGEKKMVHPFRDGNVVRCWKVRGGSKVDVHYMKVDARSDGFYLVVSPVLDTFINQFSSSEDLEKFFKGNHTPENLQEILAAMVGFSRKNGKFFNPQWDGVLAGLGKNEEPKVSEEKSEGPKASVAGSGKPRSDKERRHGHEGGRSAKKPKPGVPEDEVDVKRGASLADVQAQEVPAETE